MPSRNRIREFEENQYYHVYNRGVEKRDIFLDAQDYTVFLGLLKKYLTGEAVTKTNRHKFEDLGSQVELLAYCLMPNHFHLLLYQKGMDGITKLMRRVLTGYVMYFNNRYNRVGGLFQGRYKAATVDKDGYLHHVSRYIHLNPQDYKNWQYSSLSFYQGRKKARWIKTQNILELFNNNPQDYLDFLDDYVSTKLELDLLKWQLAGGDM